MPSLQHIYQATPDLYGSPPPPYSPWSSAMAPVYGSSTSGMAPVYGSSYTPPAPQARSSNLTSSFSSNDLVVIADLAKHLPPTQAQPAPITTTLSGYNASLAAQPVLPLATFIPQQLWSALTPLAFSFSLSGDRV